MEWHRDLSHDHAFVDLLLSGLPGEEDLQQLLRETEDKLKLNACSIEQNMKELQEKMGEPWTGERVPSPTECLQWFSPRNLATLKPVVVGHQELLDFLRELQQVLKAAEGHEEAVLQLLWNISSQCGVTFPNSSSSAPSSSPAVHTARDDSALEAQEVWNDIRVLLRRHLVDKLQTAAKPREREEDEAERDRVLRRILHLQQLSFLYPESDVLMRYQNLQRRAVLDLLQSTQSCSSARDRGFDRLALSFREASPALCSMIQEDLQVLNGVAEPHSILAFLNQVYLSTISQELGLLMEREVEMALKDNTTPGGKGGKSSSKSKTAVAPQEQPKRERSFCLTSHQLCCLTQLATALLELEQKVEDLATQVGFLNCAGEAVCSGKGIPRKAKEDTDVPSVDGKSTPNLLLQNTEAVSLEFDWRVAFRDLVPQMAHCLRVVLEDICAKSLQQEAESHAANPAYLACIDVPQREGAEPTCPERDSPKRIVKFCGDVMGELDTLLALALVCKDEALLPVRSSFVEVTGRVTSALLGRLEERAQEVPSTTPFQNLPLLLATSTYIHQRLCHYESQLRHSARMPLTLLPLQKNREVTAALHEHLTSYGLHVCVTSLLQDAESHYWADPRPFHEGERCSFSIQMWHYFLSGLRSDLWAVLPPALAQETLAQVLCQTLQVLVQRYSRAKPSYKRAPQIRCDITAVLLCVEQLMWSVCDSVSDLVRPDPASGSWVSCIHSLCGQLLSVLVIVTAPLTELCRTFQRNPDEKRFDSEVTQARDIHTPLWLRSVDPRLFSVDTMRDCSEGEGSAVCPLKLLISGPCCNPALLLQTLLHTDGLVLRALIRHSHFYGDSEVEVTPEQKKAADGFMEAVFTVLASLNPVPKALTLALEEYMDSRHLWDHLYNLADSGRSEPTVIGCIRATVTRPVTSLLTHLVGMVRTCEDRSGPLIRQDLPDGILNKIPKEWKYTHQDTKAKESSKSMVRVSIQGLSFIFTNLPSIISSLPLPIRFLFAVAEKRLSQHARQLRSTGLLVWAFLGCLCQSLEDGEALERVSCSPLERGAKERLALLSECLQVSLGQQKGVPKTAVHKVLQGLEECRPKWSCVQLQKARKLCCEGVFERRASGSMQETGGIAELSESRIRQMLLQLCHHTGGSQSLRQIYDTIQLNQEILMSRLLGPAESDTDLPPGPGLVIFCLEESEATGSHTPFNPLTQFDHIGHKKFDQSAVSEWEWDWTQLLSANQSVSHLTLRSLLSNRWEMQDAAPLDDEEKVLVEQLKKSYFTQTTES
ncbi:uncharacterized protein KIAA0825 homolog [Chanos chanos]|uniref:Uncharacterized protein KIAA0825 homolog n=1 Tax=Chanos chanos TaxID=29144 RepID=A0A6J2UNC5_CHACN|nr:uncharacterized protein KIAA0825 homolog [Chanos chanos]